MCKRLSLRLSRLTAHGRLKQILHSGWQLRNRRRTTLHGTCARYGKKGTKKKNVDKLPRALCALDSWLSSTDTINSLR